MQSINVKRLAELRRGAEIELIDVRMPTEYREVHAECARNVPLESLDPQRVMAERNGQGTQPLYVICRGGTRSSQACQRFIDAGHENVVNVEGGTLAWDKAGLPVVRGKKSLSLQQQMQITAGTLTVLGVVLAQLVHPSFIALSGFIGAGLIFAGISGYCPMSSMIARMPWNQCGDGGCEGSCSA
ncbi:rhodanese-like domain-containing protein [Rhodopirellula sp. JC639]|uniref:rhodanese-like domain-containing protein n=1 Tax=Stieleria mannarensis TaxID=2755585 RepID=UPI0016027FEB|nr:rhodanese-like domain-containing protein [Rhodopirellula sp. JC639]